MNDAHFLRLAVAEAEKFVGATAPNPPVGACLVRGNEVLGLGAHARAGGPHAEIVALRTALEVHGSVRIRGATLFVTLEPCNHHGRTPPCTKAILDAGISCVVYGEADINPNVHGGGARTLVENGVTVRRSEPLAECSRLIDGFTKRARTGRPWVVQKLAYRTKPNGELSMLPEGGQKTFTSEESLSLAHLERKKCDAILTGINTVLADAPLLNVRKVSDHEAKRRVLGVLSRSGRKPPLPWVARQNELGFDVTTYTSLDAALDDLGARGILRVLVEAGPSLSTALEKQKLWDERLVIVHHGADRLDEVRREFR